MMQFAHAMWRQDNRYNEKSCSAVVEEQNFRQWFECSISVALTVWSLLVKTWNLPCNGELFHLLWTLHFMKAYPKENALPLACGADNKTVLEWVFCFAEAIANLEPHIVGPHFCCDSLFGVASSADSHSLAIYHRSSGRIDLREIKAVIV
jgi:hypothetical protein